MLIGLFLQDEKILARELLCFSIFILQDKIGFYDIISTVRFAGDYKQWVKYFLKGIIVTAEKTIGTINLLIALREYNQTKTMVFGQAEKILIMLLDYLEQNPITNANNSAATLNLSYNTVVKDVNNLE